MLKVFSTAEAMNESTARLLLDLAEKSVKERGRFVLCLSGGNTPLGLYTLLSMKPFSELVPWKRTYIFFGDERCVPSDDERNNAYMATSALLSKIDLPLSNIFPIPVDLPPAEAAKKYEESLQRFFGEEVPRIDLILLGLGDNGHTASLFPGTAVLSEKSRWVKEVYVDELNMYRITMTIPLINKARHVLFLVTGEDKSQILKTVLTAPFQPEKYPAQLIRPEIGDVSWYADDKSSSRLLRNNSLFAEKN
jgi:6-phosphogluconolactonase